MGPTWLSARRQNNRAVFSQGLLGDSGVHIVSGPPQALSTAHTHTRSSSSTRSCPQCSAQPAEPDWFGCCATQTAWGEAGRWPAPDLPWPPGSSPEAAAGWRWAGASRGRRHRRSGRSGTCKGRRQGIQQAGQVGICSRAGSAAGACCLSCRRGTRALLLHCPCALCWARHAVGSPTRNAHS